jgi:hypothetical protein
MVGAIAPFVIPADSDFLGKLKNKYQNSQTSEYPPFEAPHANASSFDSGSIFIEGEEIFWRYFFPNTTALQPKNFRFSFEIWWANPDPNIVVIVDLSENEGDANETHNYETLYPYEEILETQGGEFIHYAIWLNSTYYFANETWASFGNEFIDEESLNLTVGIQHITYFPLFEYTITRDTSGPSIQIIHPNYNEFDNKLILEWTNTSFQIKITGLKHIRYVALMAPSLNHTTLEYDEITYWSLEDLVQDERTGIYYCPSLITEKYTGGGGIVDIEIDPPTFSANLVVADRYGYETVKLFDISLVEPYTNTTTTTNTGFSITQNQIILAGTVIGLVFVFIGIGKIRGK